MSMKNSNDTIGNRTRDLPACSAVPPLHCIAIKNITKELTELLLLLVLYGCKTWSLTLRVFENRVLRKTFGPKRDEVTGEWRRLHKRSLMICTHHQILFG
jgi:hypothetical protein